MQCGCPLLFLNRQTSDRVKCKINNSYKKVEGRQLCHFSFGCRAAFVSGTSYPFYLTHQVGRCRLRRRKTRAKKPLIIGPDTHASINDRAQSRGTCLRTVPLPSWQKHHSNWSKGITHCLHNIETCSLVPSTKLTDVLLIHVRQFCGQGRPESIVVIM